jgi:hypothetical protein
MGIFDSVGATLSSGISGAISAVETGLASGLSSVTNAISGATSSLSSLIPSNSSGLLQGLSGLGSPTSSLSNPGTSSFPLPNPLSFYATYNIIIGLSALPNDFLDNPDSTYRVGARAPLIAKSGSLDPSNRVPIAEGSQEFYIDDLKINSLIGNEKGQNTNVQSLDFKIFEPYSMGQFFEALQVAAQALGFKNWLDAPYMITLDFYGNKEDGTMEKIPKTDRQIPIKLQNMSSKTTQEGTMYEVTANPYNQTAITNAYAKFQSDLSIKGTTVQEMLQSGPKSLESVINQKLRDIADTNRIEVPDQILILFPKDIASSATSSSSNDGNTEVNPSENSATTTTNTATTITAKLNVSKNENSNLVQSKDTVNDIGRAKMGFNQTRRGDAPMGIDNDVYSSSGAISNRNKNTINVNESDMKFSQDTDIFNAINQVILQSEFIDQTLDPGAVTPEGYKGWWKIDTQVHIVGDMNKATGVPPKLLVYRIVPYKVHMSSAPTAPDVKPSGYKRLKKLCVKEYNYIYTGKNTDIIKFEINLKGDYMGSMLSDGGTANQGVQTQAMTGGHKEDNVPEVQAVTPGADPSTKPSIPTSISYFNNLSAMDKLGGGGTETQSMRAAKMFHDGVTNSNDMMILHLSIIGDPYYIAMSGTGNYTSRPISENLNEDGSISYQNGEAHIVVNFRTPVDIKQNSGLYNFGDNPTVPVASFSGAYKVGNVISTISKNQFTQELTLQRPDKQELDGDGTPSAAVSATRTEENKGPDNQSVNNGKGPTTDEATPVESQVDAGSGGGGDGSSSNPSGADSTQPGNSEINYNEADF